MNKKLIAVTTLLVLTAFVAFFEISRAVAFPGGEALFQTSLQDRITECAAWPSDREAVQNGHLLKS